MRPANIVHGYICLPGLYPYGPKNAKLDITGARIERNIVYSPRKDYLPVLEYRSFSTGPGDRLKGTHTDHNLYWCPTDPTWGQRYLDGQQPLGVENDSLSADPRFVDLEKRRFPSEARLTRVEARLPADRPGQYRPVAQPPLLRLRARTPRRALAVGTVFVLARRVHQPSSQP